MGKLLNHRYELIRPIGEGGCGLVCHARDTWNDEDVAIKIYKDSVPRAIFERAKKEFEIGISLCHPNVLSPREFNYDEEFLYLVMPYCPFGAINNLCGKIPEQTLWMIIKDVACGLEYLHSSGIMHLDIKPSNILRDSIDHYVISDFGLSHRVFSLFKSYDKTITIPLASYMSPERCCLNGKVDTYSDIWSLGVSIYELFTGEIPFNGCGGELQLSDNITTLQCNKGSIELRNLIDACISICPQNRPSAREIIALADAVIAGCDNAPLFEIKSDCTIFRQTESFHNIYNETILDAMERYTITKSTNRPLYGIVDDRGNIIVDFLYDEIHNIGESHWPAPGPLRPEFFIGAFFRQGEDVGYLIINEDGSMSEHKRCSYEEFTQRCLFT